MTVEEALNICPRCEAEYQPNVSECVDCHAPLISKAEYSRGFEPLPFSDDLVEIQTAVTSWIKQLAENLARAGIRCHVRPAGAIIDNRIGVGVYIYRHTLYVRPEHEEAARRLDRVLVGEAAEEEVAEGEGTCPACGAPRLPGVEECPDCGLFLGPGAG